MPVFSPSRLASLLIPVLLLAPLAVAQESSSSSSSAPPGQQAADQTGPANRPRIAQLEPGGAAVTLEFSEPLFDIASALNACGYDTDLEQSLPVRTEVRADINTALAGSETARTNRDALCAYIRLHHMNDAALNTGQYLSLALYLSPPPELTPNVDESGLPPQAAQVVNVLPLLRNFAEAIDLHYIWLQHRAEYEALVAQLHDPMSKMILNTNIFLHEPVSTYDGRRFLILLEPMLSPSVTNARIYGSDYIIVTSPSNAKQGSPVRLEEIRHIYLHYVVEPMIYSRGTAMQRIQPLLRGVSDAPIDFSYKSDVNALLTECLIKAIEARMYKIAGPEPQQPRNIKSRVEMDPYLAAKAAYDRETDLERDKLVALDEAHGWVLTGYFYQVLGSLAHSGGSLRDNMAQMIYGMDVERETRHAKQLLFVRDTTGNAADPLRPSSHHSAQPLAGMDLAERDIAEGKFDDAADLAEKEMASPGGDHARAQYTLARLNLIHGDPQKAMDGFEAAIHQSHDQRTVAWSHIYLGRLYDSMDPPDRTKALTEYKAALASRDSQPDTRVAAESGIEKPFALPQREKPQQDAPDFDPTGKAEKDSYKPDAPAK